MQNFWKKELIGLLILLISIPIGIFLVTQKQEIREKAQNVSSRQTDVVVAGGSSAGVGAAIGAARMGKQVILVEETNHLGGMITSGISEGDINDPTTASGIYQEFQKRVADYYKTISVVHPNLDPWPGVKETYFRFLEMGRLYEPHVAENVIKQMIAEQPNIQVIYGFWPVSVSKDGSRVTGVKFQNNFGEQIEVNGTVIIDATDTGDVAALAGAEYRVGRESRTETGERYAGVIYNNNPDDSRSTGAEDQKMQAYNYRMTIKNYGPGADKSIPMPPDYNRNNYLRPAVCCMHQVEGIWAQIYMPNSKVDINGIQDFPGANYDYVLGTREKRVQIAEKHKNYVLGYLYYIQQEKGLKNYGLPDDEYQDTGNFPPLLYVREGRRIVGEKTFTEKDALPGPTGRQPLKEDSVVIFSYQLDVHRVSPDGEGEVAVPISPLYQVPYGIIIPRDVDGLLVPLAVSATHIGYSTLRMDSVRMMLGQVAGTAASLSIDDGLQVRQVNIDKLQSALLSGKFKLYYYKDLLDADHWAFTAIQTLSTKGMIDGYSDFTFKPDNVITRAEFAHFLVNTLKLPRNTTGGPHFTDVPATHPAYQEVETLYNSGITQGYGDGRFGPSDPTTRGQVVTFIVRAKKWAINTTGGPHFTDVPATNSFYNFIETAYNNGIAKGSEGLFHPDDGATRAEASTFLYRLLILPLSTPTPSPTSSPTPSPFIGDVDHDKDVDIFDYNTLISQFGKTGSQLTADIDKDGDVDIFDYNLLVGNFGRRL